MAERTLQPEWREALEKRDGAQAGRIQHAEAFEIAGILVLSRDGATAWRCLPID